jgi:hypothetical protein
MAKRIQGHLRELSLPLLATPQSLNPSRAKSPGALNGWLPAGALA